MTAKDIDNNEELVGKELKLVKSTSSSDFKEGEIVKCYMLHGSYMELEGKNSTFGFSYEGEEWELLHDWVKK